MVTALALVFVAASAFVAGCLYEHIRTGGSFDINAENVALRDMLRDSRTWTALDEARFRHPSNQGGLR